jgi:hypothetical protein
MIHSTLRADLGEALEFEATLQSDGDTPKARELSTLGLVEVLLKDPDAADQLGQRPEVQAELFPRFLAIALASYLAYSLVMVLLLNLSPAYPSLFGLWLPPALWRGGTAWTLPVAYTTSVVLAACICLPSFYFYSLLAGVRMGWLQIVNVVGKGTGANAIMLMGVLPIYLAAMMGLVVFKAPSVVLEASLVFGLLLPFASGLWGLRTIYRGIMNLYGHQMCGEPGQRRCMLRRLTFAWAAVYTAVLPLMIYRLWEYLAM